MVQSQNQLPFVSDSLAHDQSALNTAQVPLRLAIEGNPQFYVPGKMYKGEQNISVSLKWGKVAQTSGQKLQCEYWQCISVNLL